jgi:glutaredoxin/glutathione-dependent peroxiredoxin
VENSGGDLPFKAVEKHTFDTTTHARSGAPACRIRNAEIHGEWAHSGPGIIIGVQVAASGPHPSPPEEQAMTIKVGDRIPNATLNYLKDGVQAINTDEIFKGKKVVLFSVPGAFTPTCSAKHLPGYVQKLGDFKSKGVDVACLAVNDAFVMNAWSKDQNVPDSLLMLADGNGTFSKALGLEMDGSPFGLGMRGKRFALYAEDGVVKQLHIEAPGEFKVSSAEAMLATIG